MTGVLAVISGCYVLVLGFIKTVFSRMIEAVPYRSVDSVHPKVSILVPFRNEAAALPGLIDALRQLDYPSGSLEVLMIDDHSEDESAAMVRSSGFRLVRLPAGCEGKKRALDIGNQQATGELILTTDADCRPGPQWVQAVTGPFADDQVQMVLGPVRLQAESIFGRWQAMEFGVLQAVTAASVESGNPVMANGANLCYRRSAYTAVEGYADNFQIASGDDQFLLRKISVTFPGSVRYAAAAAAMVTTFPVRSVGTFISQRIRWASKWKRDLNGSGSWAAPAVVFFQFFSWLILPYALWSGEWWLILLWLARCLADFRLIRSASRFYRFPVRWMEFLALELILPVYIGFTALASMVWQPSWKGRKLS